MKDFIASAIVNLVRDARMRKEIIGKEGALNKIMETFLKEPMNSQTKLALLTTLSVLCNGNCLSQAKEGTGGGKENESGKGGFVERFCDESTTAARFAICGEECILGVLETLGSENTAFVAPALEVISCTPVDEYVSSQWPGVCERTLCKPLYNICAFLGGNASKNGSEETEDVLLRLWTTAVRLILIALGAVQSRDSPVPAAIGSEACFPGLISLFWRTTSAELKHDVVDAVAKVLRLCPAAKALVIKDTKAMGLLLRLCNSSERKRAIDATYSLYNKNGRSFAAALNALDFSPLLRLLQDHAADTPLEAINKAIIILSYMAHNSKTARATMIKSVNCAVLLEIINSSVVLEETEKDNEEEEEGEQSVDTLLPPPPPYSEYVVGIDGDKTALNSVEKPVSDDDDDDEEEEEEEEDLDASDDNTSSDRAEEILEWKPKIIYNALRLVEQLAHSDSFRKLDGVAGNPEAWVAAMERVLAGSVELSRGLARTLGNIFTLLTACPPIKEVLTARTTLVGTALGLVKRTKRWERLLGLKILSATRSYAAAMGIAFDVILPSQYYPNSAKSEALKLVSGAPVDVIVAYLKSSPDKIALACSFSLGSLTSYPENTMHMITLCTKAAENGKYNAVVIFLICCLYFIFAFYAL